MVVEEKILGAAMVIQYLTAVCTAAVPAKAATQEIDITIIEVVAVVFVLFGVLAESFLQPVQEICNGIL
jgi:hypothetical protein